MTRCPSVIADFASKLLRQTLFYAQRLNNALTLYLNSAAFLRIAGDNPLQRSAENSYSHGPKEEFTLACLEKLLSLGTFFFNTPSESIHSNKHREMK